MDSVLKPIWTEGILVDAVNYSGLLSSGAHQAGYIFKNASSSGEVCESVLLIFRFWFVNEFRLSHSWDIRTFTGTKLKNCFAKPHISQYNNFICCNQVS